MRTSDKISHHLRKIADKDKKSPLDHFLLLLRAVYHFFKQRYVKIKQRISGSRNPTLSQIYLRLRKQKIGEHSGPLTFVPFFDALSWTDQWVKTFQHRYDLVIGLPRSGLLFANYIALKLGKPLATPDLFRDKSIWKSSSIQEPDIKRVLIVDDTITSGKTMQAALEIVRPVLPEGTVIDTAALIATGDAARIVDLHFKTIEHPRLFEWNLMHSKPGKCYYDLDGVLCENCPAGVDADEEKYLIWLENAKPYLIPNYEIDGIVSCRLEKYRTLTEKWLVQNNVKYGELILWNLSSKEDRKGGQAHFKSSVLLEKKPDIFFESSQSEAEDIFRKTSIPVLCIDDMYLCN